jgi:hypothetical protein
MADSTWIPFYTTHIKSEFCRQRLTSRIPRRQQWGLPSENANGMVSYTAEDRLQHANHTLRRQLSTH